MRTIYKYQLPFADEVKVTMHSDASILKWKVCGVDSASNPIICFWAIIDTESELVERTFRIFGTGYPFPEDADFRGFDLMAHNDANRLNKDRRFDFQDTVFDEREQFCFSPSRLLVWHIFLEVSLDGDNLD